MKKLEIQTEQGKVVITPSKNGLTFHLPTGMNGMAYDDLLFYNEEKINEFRKECKNEKN